MLGNASLLKSETVGVAFVDYTLSKFFSSSEFTGLIPEIFFLFGLVSVTTFYRYSNQSIYFLFIFYTVLKEIHYLSKLEAIEEEIWTCIQIECVVILFIISIFLLLFILLMESTKYEIKLLYVTLGFFSIEILDVDNLVILYVYIEIISFLLFLLFVFINANSAKV